MTLPPLLRRPRAAVQPSRPALPLPSALRPGVCALLAAALLAACGSTPLPPWPETAQAGGTLPPASSARPPQGQALPAPQGGVLPTPRALPALPPGQAPLPALPIPGADAPALPVPYGAELAARFPDPPVAYDTPGLAPQRRAFTTNAELGQWLAALADAPLPGSTRARLLHLGQSQRGAPLLALLLTRAAGTDPASLDTRPTVLLVGQQHGDEPAGSEALLVLARELAQGLLEPLLEHINVLLVPRANPDGAEAGTRATANGLDLGRDHLLLNTPEARALAQLVTVHRPILVLDAQEFSAAGRLLQKFNAVARHDALLQYTTTANYPEFLTRAANEWYYQPMVQALEGQGLSSHWYYHTSADVRDLRISSGSLQPDTLRNASGLKNAVGLLVATRGRDLGRLHIQRRVHTQITAIASALRSSAQRAADLEQVRAFVARETKALACREQAVVEAAATPTQRELLLLDPATGADRGLRLDWDWTLAQRTLEARARPCGYWLAQESAAAVERLRLLGLSVLRIAEPGAMLVETWRESARAAGRAGPRESAPGTTDGARVPVVLQRSTMDAPAGSYYLPLNQPRAQLAVAALEPDTQHSYFANQLLSELGQAARVMAPPVLVFEETD